MKKYGIVNPALMGALTSLGHYDTFALTDVGMPLPKDANIIDLSLVPGMPEFMTVLKIILKEVTVEAYTIFDTMKQHNPETYMVLEALLSKQTRTECSMDEWRAWSSECKFIVRTGELRPCSNVILESAPVHEMFHEIYDVLP